MHIRNAKTGKSHFSKLRRRIDDGSPRELTFSCFKGYKFLATDRARQWFINAVNEVRPKWEIDLWAYVIMPEHVHLLVAPRRPGIKVDTFAGEIKAIVGGKAVAWLEEHAPNWIPRITVKEGTVTRRRFWQPGGGYDRNVIELHTLESMIAYIHANPVRRGLVRRPEEWHWSSAQWYAGIAPVPLEMDRTLPMFSE